jgi:hypothetical protein
MPLLRSLRDGGKQKVSVGQCSRLRQGFIRPTSDFWNVESEALTWIQPKVSQER